MTTGEDGEVRAGFYARLRRLAKSGQWKQALALMRTNDLPAMKRAFRTTEIVGGKCSMTFKFASVDEMHRADNEWHDFRKATDAHD
jgi:hypothetical protein